MNPIQALVVPALLCAGFASAPLVHAAPPTAAEVGDADSFGKRVVFAGLVNTGVVTLAADCTPDPANPRGPDDRCATVTMDGVQTSFNFADIGRITLPGNSLGSLLCHWATANVFYGLGNPTGAPVQAQFRATPTYRIESEVLQDPALINALTGLPFGGGIDLGVTGPLEFSTVAPGAVHRHRVQTTRVCIAGLLSKAALLRDYGLTEQQVKRLFQKPITIRAGMSGAARFVSDASMTFSTRFVTD